MAADPSPADPPASSEGEADTQRQQAPSHPPHAGASRDMVLAQFIRLCSAVLSAPLVQESAALIVNRVSEIVRVDRAVLVKLTGKDRIAALTAGAMAAQDTSFADAVEIVCRRYGQGRDPVVIPPETGDSPSAALKKSQEAMSGTTILWVPLWMDRDRRIPPSYALWLERWYGRAWEKADIEMLHHAALFFGHGMAHQRNTVRTGKRIIRIAVAAIILIMLALPITSSVTAPARVVPDRPHHIFAPMDGILKDLFVRPGDRVQKDTLLFRYDARVLDKRLDEAYRNVAVAKAKLARLEGKAHRDPEARAEVPIQKLEVERAEADVEFFRKQQERAEVRTAKPGVIVLDDPDALIGASLQTGQAVMSVADPAKMKLHLMVPASDVGFLKEGAQVSVRLDSDPLRSFAATITRIGFDVRLFEKQIPSVLAEAVWHGEAPHVQPGQKGSAKIYGKTTTLGMQILRKPIIKLRSITGF